MGREDQNMKRLTHTALRQQ